MSVSEGSFFPPAYKQFPFGEGDLLVNGSDGGKFNITKIVRVDRVDVKQGSSIHIGGKWYVAPEDDYLLVVGVAYGGHGFDSFEEARAAALAGEWKITIGHMPLRAPGAAQDQVLVGNAAVSTA